MEVSEVRVLVRGRSEEYECCFPLVVRGTVSIHVSTYTFSPACPTNPARCVRVAIALSHSVLRGRNDLVCSLHSSLVLTMCYRALEVDL
jgi:hypothetical protein